MEAIDGLPFTVKISFYSHFRLYDAHGVLVHLWLDGPAKCHHFLNNSRLELARSTTLKSLPVYDASTDQFENVTFAFGKLCLYDYKTPQLNFSPTGLFVIESLYTDEAPARLLDLGNICVRVKRIIAVPLSQSVPAKGSEEKAVTEVIEKLLKGKAIENSIK